MENVKLMVDPLKAAVYLATIILILMQRVQGVYSINNFGGVKCSNTTVYCDTTSGEGGWLIIQRRKDGRVDFDRD